MNATRNTAAGLALLLCATCLSGNLKAAELCHTATPQTLIAWYRQTHPHQLLRYDPETSAIYHPIATLVTASPRVNWIGLAWLSPVWGAVFATGCDEKPLDVVSDGAVGKLSAGPELPELGQTVMAEYVDRETADCVHDSVSILGFKNGRIVSVWTHESKQGMNIAGKRPAFHGFVARNFAVQFTDRGQSIGISGTLNAYPYLKNGTQSAHASATKSLAAEAYYWNTKALRFLPRGHYPRAKPCLRPDWPTGK